MTPACPAQSTGDPTAAAPSAGKVTDRPRAHRYRGIIARSLLAVVLAAVSPLASRPVAAADAAAVDVTNHSEPVLCAEKDNVAIAFTSPTVRRFHIEAIHPVYITSLRRDSFEADWTACDMSADPVFKGEVKSPTRTTIYEEPDLWVVGWRMPSFWRPATARVRIGDRVESGLHLVQVWMIRPMGGEEVLVFYPQDGYWRLRPLAPPDMAPTAFGSSVLIGPVETDGRPLVRLKEISFDPKARTFKLYFERGGVATVKMARADNRATALDVSLDAPIGEGRAFAMVRSMYVTEINNDAAAIAVREAQANGWRQSPVMTFDRATATDVWIGRHSPSQHNTSSPDMVLNRFAVAP